MSSRRLIVRGAGLRGPVGPEGPDGPQGPQGEDGPQGLPGVNAVPADEAVAAYIDDPDSETRAKLSGTYVSMFIADATTYGDGVTDATAHLQGLINQAGGGVGGSLGGCVGLPRGQYLLTAPLVWEGDTFSETEQLAIPGPSIIGLAGMPGRIGDNLSDDSPVQFVCKAGVFPAGEYVIDYRTPNTEFERPGGVGAISGVLFKNFGVKCLNLGAGIRLNSGRRCRFENVAVDDAAIPDPTVPSAFGNDTGAFTLSMNIDGNAAAYNILDNCCSSGAGMDGYAINDSAHTKLNGCFSLNSARYSYDLGDHASAIGCNVDNPHVAAVAAVRMSQQGSTLIGLDFFDGANGSNIILRGGNPDYPTTARVRIIGCDFVGTDTAGGTDRSRAMVQIGEGIGTDLGETHQFVVNALFSGCTFQAGEETSTFFYGVTSDEGTPAQGSVDVRGCTFVGTPLVSPFVLNGFKNFRDDQYMLATAAEVQIAAATTLTASALGRSHACTLTSAGYTVTLPTPVGQTGKQVSVRVAGASTKLLTLATAAGNIDGQATRIMWAGESATLQSDGTNWTKISGKTIPMYAALGQTGGQTIASVSPTTVALDLSVRDNTALMTVGSSVITVVRPGIYSVSPRIGMGNAPAAVDRCILTVQKNAATVVVQNELSAQLATNLVYQATSDVVLAASDTLRMQFYHQAGSGWAVAAGNVPHAPLLSVREVPAW